MTTTIEDNQLDSELHELYTISKLWSSDLEIMDRDIQLLKKMPLAAASLDDAQFLKTNEAVAAIEGQSSETKRQLLAYLNRLEPLIDKTNLIFPLSIIEEHALIECEMASLSRSFHALKAAVLRLGEEEVARGEDHL